MRDGGAAALAAAVIEEIVRRTGISPADVDDVVVGQCYPNAEAPAIGRVAALDAGLPVEVSGLQLDRRCGSGLQAVLYACLQGQTGAARPIPPRGAASTSPAAVSATGMRCGGRGGAGG